MNLLHASSFKDVHTEKMKVELRSCNFTSRSLIIAQLFESNKTTDHI